MRPARLTATSAEQIQSERAPLGVRESAVLHALIERHIATAQPVASSHIAGLPEIALSSASVRAILADLAERGFLAQPHTSAGRVPTPKALRLYTEHFSRQARECGTEQEAIEQELVKAEHEIMTMLKHAASLLARRGGQVGMVLAPDKNSSRLRGITFVPTAANLVLAVLELEGGLISTCAIHPAEPYSRDELVWFGNFLTHRYENVSLSEMRNSIYRETNHTGRQLEDLCLRALGLSRLALEQIETERELFVIGAANLFEQAEFMNLDRMRGLVRLIEDRSRLLDLLDATLRSETVSITMAPGANDGLDACALISAPFGGSGSRGVASLIGPLRMDYVRLIPMVEGVSAVLTALCSHSFTKV